MGDSEHLHSLVQVVGAIVYTGQDMGVDVNHEGPIWFQYRSSKSVRTTEGPPTLRWAVDC